MSTPANLTKQDAAIRNALDSMRAHIDDMINSGRTVERIKEEIAAGYFSGASSAFQGKLDDWQQRYHQVIAAFEKFVESTQGADAIINKAEDEALAIANRQEQDRIEHALYR